VDLINEILTGKTKKYCSISNAKAHGLNLCLKYPSSWFERDGNRPHVLVKLRGSGKPEMVMLLIFNKKEIGITKKSASDFTEADLISLSKEAGGQYLSANRNLKIDGISAVYYDMYQKGQQLDKQFEIYYRNYILLYKDWFIQILCGVSNDDNNTFSIKNLKGYFESHKRLFDLIVNSTIIVNQWN